MKSAQLLPLVCLLACSSETAPPPVPAPEPTNPPAAETDEPPATAPPTSAEPATEDSEPSVVAPAQPAEVAAPMRTRPEKKLAVPRASKKAAAAPRAEPQAGATAQESTAPKAEPTKTTRIPSTKNVHVRVQPALQKLLDGDSRMQPWINKVMQVADQCYAQVRAKDAAAAGVIKVQITMHESARPSPDIQDLPPALSGVVACATGALFQTRMPLFTGPEGQRHRVSIHFGS